MRVLYLTDRLGLRGGAGRHLFQVISSARGAGAEVTVAYGRRDAGAALPGGVLEVAVRGLAAPVATTARLGRLPTLLANADCVHLQNVMNPVALEMAVGTGRAVATVQDHRVFCPSLGKTLPDGSRCATPMSIAACGACIDDRRYLTRTLELTGDRRDALRGARLVVLSAYMAVELEAAGLPGAEVLPPWVDVGCPRSRPGDSFLLAGRLVTHKGVIGAWRAWRGSGVQLPLRVAGEGPLGRDLKGCDMLSWLDDRELCLALRASRALLFPALWQEPFGILGVQALAEGTPVVVADSGGTGEWSDEGCIRVPPGDEGAMAEALRRLETNPGEALELGRRGQAMVAERFSKPVIEAKLRQLYSSV